LVDQLRQGPTDTCQRLSFGELPGALPGHDDQIGSRLQAPDLLRKRLPQQALDAVAFNRASDLAGYRQSQPRRLIAAAREDVKNQFPSRM
jgi:hypothetical protein